ncbi:MAG TPA: PLP-dependent transferase [Petrimonas sp.]|uniref:trans-sulfuration enzyme family protein n=1 Tax=Petrimonas sp. TaxID=2023866 RepID=UPI00176868ED|nr:PLP-dependent transferase [Petrimonas sp.]
MSEKTNYSGISTNLVHAGERPDPVTGSVIPPIYQTTTFAFETNESIFDLMEGRSQGYIYTRYGNPNYTMAEAKIAYLEEGENALVLASGMAATSTAVLAILKAGDHLITHTDIYGGSFGLFYEVLPRFGIEVSFVDFSDLTQIEDTIKKNTKVIFFESPSNPSLKIFDIRKISALAHENDIRVIVDNTFATPYNQKPLNLGADVVVHSCTKFINGHSDVMAGAIIGKADYINECINIFRKLGGSLNGIDTWLMIRGMKTFGLRMERHNQNGQKVAEFLSTHPLVEKIYYPGLPQHERHELAKSQMTGFGSVMSIEVKGGQNTVNAILNRVKLFTRAVSLGSVESLITQPVAAVHYSVPAEYRKLGGITDNMIRISVGIEEVEDVIADLVQALDIP